MVKLPEGRPAPNPKDTHMLKQFLKNEEGATAIEYGLIAPLIAVVIGVQIMASFLADEHP